MVLISCLVGKRQGGPAGPPVSTPQGPVAQLVSAPPCHGGGRGFKSRQGRSGGDEKATFRAVAAYHREVSSRCVPGSVAQLVERTTENRKVTGSTPVGATEPSRGFYTRGFFAVRGGCAILLRDERGTGPPSPRGGNDDARRLCGPASRACAHLTPSPHRGCGPTVDSDGRGPGQWAPRGRGSWPCNSGCACCVPPRCWRRSPPV